MRYAIDGEIAARRQAQKRADTWKQSLPSFLHRFVGGSSSSGSGGSSDSKPASASSASTLSTAPATTTTATTTSSTSSSSAKAASKYPPLPLQTRWKMGTVFLFFGPEHQARLCDACDRYRERVLRDTAESKATQDKCRALGLDADAEMLVMYALQKKHETRVYVHIDSRGPASRPWTWRWLAANLIT